ncbi:MAG TPA: peptidoglycan-binding domain-containing protein [Polyangium sp.]|nr:peptidoglycan-binding domain-containing protein [Polyangium sp.]
MKPYLVKQGDHLAKIAFCLGIDPEETWNHPLNAELRAQREPNVLAPGDILHVPISHRQGLPFTQGATNRYQGAIPRAPLRIVFQAAGKAIADEPFEVRGLGWPLAGATDGSGILCIEVPVHVHEIDIHFTRLDVVFPVLIGDMDPVEELSGIRKRLEQLGYYRGFESIEADVRNRLAIESFQRRSGIEPTGKIDEATKKALVDVYGS